MKGWKKKRGKSQALPVVKPQGATPDIAVAEMFAQLKEVGFAAAAKSDELRRSAAKRARRDATRRARRLVASWVKATVGWRPEDAVSDLEVRVSRAIRSATERGGLR